ncbi:hypothetical protein [Bacillus sp. RAR_GA_16]|uniref:hypothetical protein n=1 Tax=Bacillus sp. RAR_GA_16 TaxID=2876774 RepID=UPI001CCFCB12|nr:hypothetical protein [Bacillus sp. RAR_GA_16]MCA0173031.1 hypothetical protein [Bacillus sp. RAR_GA_16]
MEKRQFWVVLLVATCLGLFGQDLAYVMNDFLFGIGPIYYLTFFTGFSIFLYLFIIGVTMIKGKNLNVVETNWKSQLVVACFIGLPISVWSLFVVAMWWG